MNLLKINQTQILKKIIFGLDKTSGSISIEFNGDKQKKFSLYEADRILSKMFGAGSFELSKGDYKITLIFEGEVGETIGLDFLQVQNLTNFKQPG